MEIHELSALDLAAALARGEVSAVEVLEHTEERMAGVGAEVGAFAHATPELARTQAEEADRTLAAARRSGEKPPPFLGVPVPIKDLNQVAGQPFEAGSALMAGNLATHDDGVVTFLREAGTVMVGKTTTPEFGFPCYTEPAMGPGRPHPVGPDPHGGWLLGRGSGRRCRGCGAGGAGLGRGRVPPHPGCLLRCGGPEALAGPREPGPVRAIRGGPDHERGHHPDGAG